MNNFNFNARFSGNDNLFATFTVRPTNKNEKVRILRNYENSILAEISKNGKTHFELYWFISDPNSVQKTRDDFFREGHNIIIKVFSFACGGQAEYYQDFVIESPDLDPSRYCRATFDFPSYLRDNPPTSKQELQFLI